MLLRKLFAFLFGKRDHMNQWDSTERRQMLYRHNPETEQR